MRSLFSSPMPGLVWSDAHLTANQSVMPFWLTWLRVAWPPVFHSHSRPDGKQKPAGWHDMENEWLRLFRNCLYWWKCRRSFTQASGGMFKATVIAEDLRNLKNRKMCVCLMLLHALSRDLWPHWSVWIAHTHTEMHHCATMRKNPVCLCVSYITHPAETAHASNAKLSNGVQNACK